MRNAMPRGARVEMPPNTAGTFRQAERVKPRADAGQTSFLEE